ncbi:hypothetical protein SKAU_G00083250 [Synaphobranchus kaupii]|uniref:Uncharacterized protein n=1 Tax=Synaphobranchus kaupii TaxID=118154 RepID=A0A9Q1J4P6_SYNKA|nr:hypothetical protein SKAU_G00083250 [Synaphobranchus kaupii]
MLRYLIKTLLQMNLFTGGENGTELLTNLNSNFSSLNPSFLDFANITSFNAAHCTQHSRAQQLDTVHCSILKSTAPQFSTLRYSGRIDA